MGEEGTTAHDEGGACCLGDKNAMQLEGCDDCTVGCEYAEKPLSYYSLCCVSQHLWLRHTRTRTNARTRGSSIGTLAILTRSTKLEL